MVSKSFKTPQVVFKDLCLLTLRCIELVEYSIINLFSCLNNVFKHGRHFFLLDPDLDILLLVTNTTFPEINVFSIIDFRFLIDFLFPFFILKDLSGFVGGRKHSPISILYHVRNGTHILACLYIVVL